MLHHAGEPRIDRTALIATLQVRIPVTDWPSRNRDARDQGLMHSFSHLVTEPRSFFPAADVIIYPRQHRVYVFGIMERLGS